ncbi:MAG: DUF6261 family protein [Tannerellaceae bacterium]|jgi:hypothetical protein|nr:DUF6261 family protein [Tannerellaceae bacterium]
MTLIKAFASLLFRLRNNEHFTLMMNIVKFITEREVSLPAAIVPLWTALKKQFEKEDDIFKRSAMAVETKYIVEANRERGNNFMFIRRTVEAAAYSAEEELKDASVKLGEVMHNYRSIVSVAMNEVTALVYNMIEDLGKPRYSDAVKQLGLEDAIASLEASNNAFNDLYIERAERNETSGMQGTMRYIRPIVDKAFKAFADGVNTLHNADKLTGASDKDVYTPIIVFINGLVDQYELTIARRTSATTTGKDKPDAGNDGDDDETPYPVEPLVPILTVAEQRIDGAKTMTLIMADQEAFAAALYPVAAEGMMVLVAESSLDGSHTHCPIKSYFEMDGDTPIGLCVRPPEENFNFVSPLQSLGPCTAEVTKDDVLLAVLTNMEWPVCDGE